MEKTHDGHDDGKPQTTQNGGPNTNITAFLVQNTDKAHTDKNPTNRRRRGNDVASTTHIIYIDHHPS